MSTIRDLWDLGEPWEPQVARNWGEAISDAVDEVPNRTLDDLSDVDASAPDIGDVIVYDGVNWVPQDPDKVLDDLTDVDVSSASSGDVLVFDGNNWVPGDTDKTLDDLTDVNVTTASANDALIYDGTNWVPGDTDKALDDLTDVDVSTAQDGEALIYDDGTWVPGDTDKAINDLTDVSIDNTQDGDLLFFDEGSGEWSNKPFPGVELRNADIVVSVGPDGEFQTINDALTFLSGIKTSYSNDANKAIIRLTPDFEMNEQVLVDGQDFSWVTILSDAGTSPVQITSFDEGQLIPDYDQAQQVQVVVSDFSAGDADNLDNHFISIDDADDTTYLFWYQVNRFAEVVLDSRVRVTDDTPGESDKEVEVTIGGVGASLNANLNNDTIELTLGTTSVDTQASGSVFSDDGGIVSISADQGGPFDGSAGNVGVEFIDTGSGGLSASFDSGDNEIKVDLGGETSVTTSEVATEIDGITGFSASESEPGTFTAEEDLGSVASLFGGTNAGTFDAAQNTAELVVAAIDSLSGVSAEELFAGTISTEGTFPLVGGEGQSTDPSPQFTPGPGKSISSVEITIDTTFSAEDAANELRTAVDNQATLSIDSGESGRVVTIINDTKGATATPLRVGAFLSLNVTIEGRDEGYQTLVNAPGHTFSDGDRITIRGHVGLAEEVDYNGRWTVAESDQGEGTFELDFVADPRSIFNEARIGVPDTAEAVLPENVPVSRQALNINFEFFYFPAFGVARGTLPTIGCVFEMDESGDNTYLSYKDGLCATDQGRINLLPFSGFVNAGGSNIYATRSSIINANDAIADGAKRHGFWAYSNSIINARRASATNCGDVGFGEDVGGGFDSAGTPIGSGVIAERGSLINAEGVDATGSASSAFMALYGGQVNVGADPGLAQGFGTSSAGMEFQVLGGTIFGVNGDSQGWITPPVNAPEKVVTENTTLELTDRGHVVAFDSTDNLTLTVPSDLAVDFPLGTIIGVYRAGTGEVDIQEDTGVTIRNIGSISEQFGEVSLRKRAANEWVLVGEVD